MGGFTLLELLVVLVVAAIAAGVVGVAGQSYLERSVTTRRCATSASQLRHERVHSACKRGEDHRRHLPARDPQTRGGGWWVPQYSGVSGRAMGCGRTQYQNAAGARHADFVFSADGGARAGVWLCCGAGRVWRSG